VALLHADIYLLVRSSWFVAAASGWERLSLPYLISDALRVSGAHGISHQLCSPGSCAVFRQSSGTTIAHHFAT